MPDFYGMTYAEYEEVCDLVCYNLSFGIPVENTLTEIGKEELIPDLVVYNYLLNRDEALLGFA